MKGYFNLIELIRKNGYNARNRPLSILGLRVVRSYQMRYGKPPLKLRIVRRGITMKVAFYPKKFEWTAWKITRRFIKNNPEYFRRLRKRKYVPKPVDVNKIISITKTNSTK